MQISTIFGMYTEGYLHGEALEAAQKIVADNGRVSAQGPSMGNNGSRRVTLLTKTVPNQSGWSVWGTTFLYDEPD